MSTYYPRVVEKVLHAQLRRTGAVLVTGPKAVGKTTTARALSRSEVRLDRDRAALTAARVDPGLVLTGAEPRLIDEYQLVDGLYEAVRGRVDDERRKGMYILTGSALPPDHVPLHTGARRIAHLSMRTMSLYERQYSSGAVSLAGLLDGDPVSANTDRTSVRDVVQRMAVGGWPDNLGLSVADAIEANQDYIDVLVNVDIERVEGVRRNPDGVRALLRSYARNIATDASLKTIGRAAEDPLPYSTLKNYLGALQRLFLIEDQAAWAPRLRSRARLTATPRRHLADPSLAVAALGATPDRLLGPEIEWCGFLFESQVVHDLRIYAQASRGEVRFYRDNTGLEVDAVVEHANGRWAAFEMKLGQRWVDEAASNLLSLRDTVSREAAESCGALVVVTPDSVTHVRPDGVIVTSPAALGP